MDLQGRIKFLIQDRSCIFSEESVVGVSGQKRAAEDLTITGRVSRLPAPTRFVKVRRDSRQ